MSSKRKADTKRQTSLLKFKGFTKKIVHNNKSYNVVDSGFASAGPSGTHKCPSCGERKKSKPALSQHMLWKHANYSSVKSNVVENIANHVQEKEIKENVKKTVDFLLNAIEDSENTPEERAVDTNENGQTIVTKTSNKEERRHYDYRFKLKVIEQVDDGNLAIDVAPHHNISKSLVSRWLKNRK